MQNYVYRTRKSALAAPDGKLTLAVCGTCGFAWNRAFEPDRLVYDEGYDNAVPSAVMDAYYEEIAGYLHERYDLTGGLVVDVGCGDGGFLRVLCAAVPGLRGLGVDPALESDRSEADGRIVLIKDAFASEVVREQPSLVVSRHVLEHIPQPVAFLRTISDSLSAFDPCPCFFEFPDLEWILANEAFWDFAYEHCNYFTAGSATAALARAGLTPVGASTAFGSQYLWIEGMSRGPRAWSPPSPGGDLLARSLAYAETEGVRMERVRQSVQALKSDGRTLALWGMATKGVLFSLLTDPDAVLVDHCIDVNPNKQDCYVPLSGHVIRAPEALMNERELTVLVMNENYADEIRRSCRELGIDPTLVDAGIRPL
jgi:hypothetical protein